jgi:hypothetical protein
MPQNTPDHLQIEVIRSINRVFQSQLFGHPNSAPTLPQFVPISLFGTNWGRVRAELGHKLMTEKLTLKHPNIEDIPPIFHQVEVGGSNIIRSESHISDIEI